VNVIRLSDRKKIDSGLDRIYKILKLIKKDQRTQLIKKAAEKKLTSDITSE
jgi:hypothetical protein